MDTTKKVTLKVTSQQLEDIIKFIRQSGRPHSLEALTKRYIDLLKEKEGITTK